MNPDPGTDPCPHDCPAAMTRDDHQPWCVLDFPHPHNVCRILCPECHGDGCAACDGDGAIDGPPAAALEHYPLAAPCEYCGTAVWDHAPSELRSCAADLRSREQEAEALNWWRSQQ